MNPTKRRTIFERFLASNPEPRGELHFNSSFELLIAVILSAQATDKSVNRATDQLYQRANTPESILKLGQKGLEKYVKAIGLYRTKAKNIIATCKLLLSEHQGEVPHSRVALEALPGVGRKTANECSISRLASPPLRWILTSFASATAPALRRAKHRWRSRSDF